MNFRRRLPETGCPWVCPAGYTFPEQLRAHERGCRLRGEDGYGGSAKPLGVASHDQVAVRGGRCCHRYAILEIRAIGIQRALDDGVVDGSHGEDPQKRTHGPWA